MTGTPKMAPHQSPSASPRAGRRRPSASPAPSATGEHRGSVCSVAALAAVLAAAPASVMRGDPNAAPQSPRSRQRPLALPGAGAEPPDVQLRNAQHFLEVPPIGQPSAGGCSSTTPASSSGKHSPAFASATTASCSPLPNHFDHHPTSTLLRRQVGAASEPNVSVSAGHRSGKPVIAAPFLRSLRQLKFFKRQSASEITLVLELLRGGTRAADDEEETEVDALLDAEEKPDYGAKLLSSRRSYRHHTASPMPERSGGVIPSGKLRRTATTLTRRTTSRSAGRRPGLRKRIQWAKHYSPAAIQRRFVRG